MMWWVETGEDMEEGDDVEEPVGGEASAVDGYHLGSIVYWCKMWWRWPWQMEEEISMVEWVDAREEEGDYVEEGEVEEVVKVKAIMLYVYHINRSLMPSIV